MRGMRGLTLFLVVGGIMGFFSCRGCFPLPQKTSLPAAVPEREKPPLPPKEEPVEANLEEEMGAEAEEAEVEAEEAEGEEAEDESLPPHGEFVKYQDDKEYLIPVEFKCSSLSPHFFVKIEDWDTEYTVATVFIHSGKNATIMVPAGSFRLKYASGKVWHNEDELFGPDTVYQLTERQVDFELGESYIITLYMTPGGNLPTENIEKSSW